MVKKKQELDAPLNDEVKEVIEVPEKVGFGMRDSYILTETLENRITYAKNGKGDEEIVFVINEIKTKDPQAQVERGDGKISVLLTKPFEVRSFKAPRKALELSEREQKRLSNVVEAIVDSDIPENDYTDELFEKGKENFPKIVKYYSDDENEMFYIKNEKEIWIAEEYFASNGALILALCTVYFKLKGLERNTEQYLKKFEDVVEYYI